MKIIIYAIITAFLIGCEKGDGIEIIPDYDAIYLPIEKVDMPAKVLDEEDKHIEKIQEIISKNYIPENEAYYFFKSTLFINDKGFIEKVKYSTENPDKDFGDAEINPRIEKLFPDLTAYLRNVNFTPAILEGKNVSSQFKWEGSFRVDKNGKAEAYLFSLDLSGLKNLKFIDKNKFLENVDEMPFPIGGMKALAENVVYPRKAKEEGIEGKVFVKAFIDEEGNVVETDILKGIGAGCDEAAEDAVEKTKFKPGRQNGKPVKVQVMIPIMFKLQ